MKNSRDGDILSLVIRLVYKIVEFFKEEYLRLLDFTTITSSKIFHRIKFERNRKWTNLLPQSERKFWVWVNNDCKKFSLVVVMKKIRKIQKMEYNFHKYLLPCKVVMKLKCSDIFFYIQLTIFECSYTYYSTSTGGVGLWFSTRRLHQL